jgi:hypothetical protein
MRKASRMGLDADIAAIHEDGTEALASEERGAQKWTAAQREDSE